MYGFNPGGLVQYSGYNPPPMVQTLDHAIRCDVPNISYDGNGKVYINTLNRRGNNCIYLFSDNLAFVKVECFKKVEDTSAGGKSTKNKSGDILRFTLWNDSIFVKRKNIKGEYLIDRLTAIGVVFHIDAPKTKRSEAINQMVNRSCQVYGTNYITDEATWSYMEGMCEE